MKLLKKCVCADAFRHRPFGQAQHLIAIENARVFDGTGAPAHIQLFIGLLLLKLYWLGYAPPLTVW
jgi:hypothetical protein